MVNPVTYQQPLPRLAVVADLPVERTVSGQLLLYRLLADYPADRLRVVYNQDFAGGRHVVGLPRVRYLPMAYRIPRIIRNRFNPFWPVMAAGLAFRLRAKVLDFLGDFATEAVLTVSHDYLWFTAAAVAQRLCVPLHLILHDDWASLQTSNRAGWVPDAVRRAARGLMGRVYRQAQSRLCVSPGMAERCRDWFGVDGKVLYPSRGADSPQGRIRVRTTSADPPVAAFCGMIHQAGTVDLLRALATGLALRGGRLDLYTPSSPQDIASGGLRPPAVRVVGFFHAAEMADRLAETAHALILTASFDPREREDVSTLFPSKLADYTAVGLPIIVWGPSYSSAARWAAENHGATVGSTDPDPEAVVEWVVKLANDPTAAAVVASAAVEAGKRYFELSVARQTFLNALGCGPAKERGKVLS